MERSPSGQPSSALVSTTSPIKNTADMSTLAIPPPLAFPPFRRETAHWDSFRPAVPSLPRLDTRNALPSIRELVPEHLLSSQPQERASSGPKTLLASPAAAVPGLQTSPGYTHISEGHKKRKLSEEEYRESERARQVPRLYHPSEPTPSYPRRESPPAAAAAAAAPPPPSAAPSRPEAYYGESQAPRPLSSGKYGPSVEANERGELRQSVPSLMPSSSRPYEREGHSQYHHEDGYHSRVPAAAQARIASTEQQQHQQQPPPSSYRGGEFTYSSYQSSSRFASAPSSATTYERTPFTAPPYGMQYGEYGRFGGDMGPGGLSGETKQRKRRGNLPKETTDKLRAWFVAHLQHPYPTEDEKQELMRQTGLQMNQISNWFINARRRQLPNMINDARAESEAMSGGRSLGKTELGRYSERGSRGDLLNLSEGEGRHYEEDMMMRRVHAHHSRDSV